ncbi:hypothetical protein BDZ94DRAFT_1321736 [Collybia nuda]|uniref:Uncharacterized protein n=1 Tax=Collybia nuda TaxID=64659 RepID=A0A9P5Y6J0_9AGAR|nr:hypothetical protein BDZ94DRAFT_1321736 [Collybia nuda]
MQTDHFSQPPLSSAGEPVVIKAKPKNRLSKEGNAVLEAYIRDHPDEDELYTDLEVRKKLLEQLHALPGLENYAAINLKNWLKRRLQKKPSVPTPTLKKETMKQLAVLCQGQPNPPPDVIKVWSQLLHVSQDEIIAYMKSQSFEDYEDHPSSSNHLPTPVSASPEPYSDNISYKSDPTISPRVPAVFPSHPFERTPQFEHPLSHKSLIQAIAKVASHPEPLKKPTTSREFNEMFAEYGRMMENFIQKNDEYLKSHSPSS